MLINQCPMEGYEKTVSEFATMAVVNTKPQDGQTMTEPGHPRISLTAGPRGLFPKGSSHPPLLDPE